MKLGFDATSLSDRGKGVARFQREFLHAADVDNLIPELDVFVPSAVEAESLPLRDGWRYHRVETKPMVVWEQVGRPRLARRLGLDAVITLSERGALWGPPEVVYVFEHPRHRVSRSRELGVGTRQRIVDVATLVQFRLTRIRAAAVIAASQATADDIGTTRVVYSAVSPAFSPDGRDRTHFLHIASDDPRDNSLVVIDAVAEYGSGAPPLVIAGPVDRTRPALESRAKQHGVTVEWRGFQTGSALLDLYRGAIAYIDPSLYEGFGLQAAEALACGTPVIASNRTSLPEVVGDAGILLDPNDVKGFAEAMRRIVEDPALATSLGQKAIAQAARFTWSATVRGILEVCSEVAE